MAFAVVLMSFFVDADVVVVVVGVDGNAISDGSVFAVGHSVSKSSFSSLFSAI